MSKPILPLYFWNTNITDDNKTNPKYQYFKDIYSSAYMNRSGIEMISYNYGYRIACTYINHFFL